MYQIQVLGFNIPKDFFENTDIHIHAPEAAIAREGPSAGVAITTVLESLKLVFVDRLNDVLKEALTENPFREKIPEYVKTTDN